MQATTVASAGQARLAAQQRRGQAPGRRAPRSQVVAAVASLQKSSSPLLEGLVAEGIITADEAVSCSPDQLEFLIRKRFRPDSTPEQASIQAYVADGVITQDELEKCSADQLEFLIRKRSSSPEASANVVPWSSPSKEAPQHTGSDAVNGETVGEDPAWGGIQAYIANGILTTDEVEKCSPAQLEFLIRKRSPSPPAKEARIAARTPARPAPKVVEPEPEAPQEAEFVQLSLEEYLAQGVVTEYEIEMCSPTQLEFLIRKRTEVATAAASSPPASPKRGRSRGPVRVPPVAAVQAAAASAAPTVEEEEEAPPQKLVVPRAPPLTDDPDMQRRSLSPVARKIPEREQEGGMPWAGAMAAAGLTVVGLSAGLYFAGRDNVPAPAAPSAMQQPAPAKAQTARLADKVEVPKAAPQAVPPPPAAKVEKVESKAAAPAKVVAPEPKVEEKKAAPAPAAAALKTDTKPAVPAPPKQEEEKKPASKVMAEKLAAELASDLAVKQRPAAAPAAPTKPRSSELSRGQSAAGGTLAAAGVVLAGLLVPGAREALFSRFAGEAAVLKTASAKTASLQKLVDAQQGDLRILQDQLAVAQAEYGAALSKLNGAKGALASLSSRVVSSEKAAKALVADLERFPSKEAQRLKSEAATIAASVSTQRMAVERALAKALKDL